MSKNRLQDLAAHKRRMALVADDKKRALDKGLNYDEEEKKKRDGMVINVRPNPMAPNK